MFPRGYRFRISPQILLRLIGEQTLAKHAAKQGLLSRLLVMAKRVKPIRALKRSNMDPKSYEVLDVEWRQIGLAAPARQALVDAKLYKISDLRRISLAELQGLKGMGKSAVARIRLIMEAKKISFLEH